MYCNLICALLSTLKEPLAAHAQDGSPCSHGRADKDQAGPPGQDGDSNKCHSNQNTHTDAFPHLRDALGVGLGMGDWVVNAGSSSHSATRYPKEKSSILLRRNRYPLHLREFLDRVGQILPRMGGGDLGTDAGLALGDDREGKADDVDAPFQQCFGDPTGQ